VLGVLTGAAGVPLAAQAAVRLPAAQRFDVQIRAAANLERPAAAISRRAPMKVAKSNAPLIGAIIGAVALPTIGYLVFHDRDSGGVQIGTVLPIAVIGAFIGLMIGLHVRG